MELYIHIPFCVRKCAYCDFVSFPREREGIEAYLNALKQEITAAPVLTGPVETVFIGGGTPSLLTGAEVGELLELLRCRFPFGPDPEITLEANPGTLTRDKLLGYKAAGINRISLGCQSIHDRELKKLGRIHDARQIQGSVALIREAGFDNLNLDLMSAIPGQTTAFWQACLEWAVSVRPEHISAYSLILEEGTPFWDRQDELDLPSEEEERQMIRITEAVLGQAGYQQYEISNYALPGFECRHNAGYWTGAEYLGFGVAAAGYYNGERYTNTADLIRYLENAGCPAVLRAESHPLTQGELMEEMMFLGLRMTCGVSRADFLARFGVTMDEIYGRVIAKHTADGLLDNETERIRLTRRGLDLANRVMADFLLEDEI